MKEKQNITQPMIDSCYKYGCQIYAGKVSAQQAWDMVCQETGMNVRSANDYLMAVKFLLSGRRYGHTIKYDAVKTYFDNILRDFGKDALSCAITATELHTGKYPEYGHGSLTNIEKLYGDYKQKIDLLRK
jgi:hypothetical protein